MKKQVLFLSFICMLTMVVTVGCGKKESSTTTSNQYINQEVASQGEENKEEDTSESVLSETNQEESVEKIKREGNRSNPFIAGDEMEMHFYAYTIQSYGDVKGKLLKYKNGIATFEYSLQEFGKDNPLYFPKEFNADYLEKNQNIYIYPCEDPTTFSVSDYESYNAKKEVAVPCGGSGKVKYKVGEQNYLAMVWYTLSEDGGEKDFVDNDLYGHIVFYDLNN